MALVLLVRPTPATGQRQTGPQQRCDLMQSDRVRSILTGDGGRITYVSGPALFSCEDGTRIRADSAVEYTSTRFRELIGDVEIDGPETRVRADRIHLSAGSGRTQAWGGVRVLEKESETRMRGDTLVLLRAGEVREQDELRMWGGRPHAVLRLQGGEVADTTASSARGDTASAGPPSPDTASDPQPSPDTVSAPRPPVDTASDPPPPPPDTVFADRLYMEGRSRFLAAGSVRIRRSRLDAFGDSLDYVRTDGRALLLGRDTALARVEGEEYELVGREVDLRIREGRVREVRAARKARVTGEDVRIDAPRIRVFLNAGRMDRLVAVRAADPVQEEEEEAEAADSVAASGKAVARAEDIVLRADSIDVTAPGRSPERVHAVGDARGETLGRDSLNTARTPELIRRDWIEGDTVVAHFRPVDPAAEAPEPGSGGPGGSRSRLERLVASGNARSLYRLTPRDSAARPGPDAPDSSAGAGAGPSDTGAAAPGAAEEASGGPPPAAGGEGEPGNGSTEPAGSRLAVHYVVGDRITIVLREGEVEHMEVVGQTRGLYLQPRPGPPGTPPRPDTTARPPEAPADGGADRPPGGGGRP